jgi:hypothetical protein
LIRANDAENSELYWGLRGGGGNFGVVTEFEVRLHPLTAVLLASSYCRQDDITLVLRDWREFMPGAPDELKWNISLVLAPNDNRVPDEIRGKPALSSSIVWFGDEGAGRRHINRIFSVGEHVACKMELSLTCAPNDGRFRFSAWPPLLHKIRIFRRVHWLCY